MQKIEVRNYIFYGNEVFIGREFERPGTLEMSTQHLNEIHSLLLLSILEYAPFPGKADKMILKCPLTCFGINARHQETEERSEEFNFEPISRTSCILLSMGKFSNFKNQ